ncbi:Aste57867_15179 [Aphanomyces stellatus]|uniref:Aste57867_15179 protein n=1 Tax=Aphanomyces stellatus TaxID=120398 RepID=A0A485L2K5_9STRA|nr:hypothetical protein As57867_015123 [Aphanomyces stellatus]VFT91988.1 Aste57867_15179 [Aphanomyces stellatus]
MGTNYSGGVEEVAAMPWKDHSPCFMLNEMETQISGNQQPELDRHRCERRVLASPGSSLVDLCVRRVCCNLLAAETPLYDLVASSSTTPSTELPTELVAKLLACLVDHGAMTQATFRSVCHLAGPTIQHLRGCLDLRDAWLDGMDLSHVVHVDVGGCTRLQGGARSLLPPLVQLRFASFANCRQLSSAALARMLRPSTHLAVLDLSGCDRLNDTALRALRSLQQLVRVNLSRCGHITDRGLSYLPLSIQELAIARCDALTDVGLRDAVANMVRLTALDLSHGNFTNQGMLWLAEGVAPRLRRLAIAGCQHIDQDGLEGLGPVLECLDAAQCGGVRGPMALWTQLKELTLARCGCRDMDMMPLASMVHLRALNVSRTGRALTTWRMKQWSTLTDLRHLSMAGSTVDDETLLHLCLHLHDLERLDVAHTAVSDAGMVHLKHLAKLAYLNADTEGMTYHALPFICEATTLTSLDVFGASIADRGLEHLAKVPHLTKLVICGGRVSDAGVRLIAMHAPQLTRLNLSQNRNIHSHALAHVAKLPHLASLNLSHTSISTTGLHHLLGLTQLRTIAIYGVEVTDEMVALLTGMHRLFALCSSSPKIDCPHSTTSDAVEWETIGCPTPLCESLFPRVVR